MTLKTLKLISDISKALFKKKAVLLTGNTGVGKTFLAKQVISNFAKDRYSCFRESSNQNVITEIISCHNSLMYEDIVGGISAETESGKMSFKYIDKILVETIRKASDAYYARKGTRFVLLFDDMQRCDVSSLFGDAIDAIGAESHEVKICLNSGLSIDVTPNFYIIATYNSSETDAMPLSNQVLRKFYVREILSDIGYITKESTSDNALLFENVRSIVMNNLDMQYKTSTYEQNRYLPGHGYFVGDDLSFKIKYQLVPLLKQYVSEGILDNAAQEHIRLLEESCNDLRKKKSKMPEPNCFSDYCAKVSKSIFISEDSTSRPINNLIGRIIDQRFLSNDQIKNNLLFNTSVCYREKEVGGITYQAMLLADSRQYNNIKRSSGDRRKLYNGGTIKIDDVEYYFTGGMQPKEYTVKNPKRKLEIWEIFDGYELGESTSPNVILYRIVWQYYKTIIEDFQLYLKLVPTDVEKSLLLDFIKQEWEKFLSDFKKIRPKPSSDASVKAINNKDANKEVRELIGKLQILWTNPGDVITLPSSSIILEGVDKDMIKNIYKEYNDAMEELGIKQMILQGPPGTSKTFSAKEFLKFLVGNDCSDADLAQLQIINYSNEDEYCKKLIDKKGKPEIAWDIVQFHPSYGYEDFIRGINVSTKPGSDAIMYETVNKVLGSIAELAQKHADTKFFLIIDEINRANLATVFGELIYGLEYRTESVATPYSVNDNNRITIPDNLYIIGTMNTADKSIGGIDYAIRRRFLFFEQLPDESVINSYKVDLGGSQIDLNQKSCNLFNNVKKVFDEYLSPEYRKEDVQIGHTYFLVDSEKKLQCRFVYQIIPILKEYYKDGIIGFDSSDDITGFNGFLNCISGKINMTSQKEDIEKIFIELIK